MTAALPPWTGAKPVEVVGKDRHPLMPVRDFAPCVAKIEAAGAATVITVNWGAELALMIEAAKDAGLKATFRTYCAGATGVPTRMVAAGADRVHQPLGRRPARAGDGRARRACSRGSRSASTRRPGCSRAASGRC